MHGWKWRAFLRLGHRRHGHGAYTRSTRLSWWGPGTWWPVDGKSYAAYGVAGIVPGPAGGAIVIAQLLGPNSFLDANYFTYGLDSNGSTLPPWSSGPKPFELAPGDQRDIAVASDGAGGLYASWTDNRNYAQSGTDVFIQHINQNGDPVAGWPVDGTAAIASAGFDYKGIAAGDATSGVYALANVSPDVQDMWVAHLTASGSVAPTWTPGGEPVRSIPTNLDFGSSSLTTDGRGGAFASFAVLDPTTQTVGIVVQHLSGDAPVPAQLSLVTADAANGRVSLEWFAANGAIASATVERMGPEGVWSTLGSVMPDGSGNLKFEDVNVVPGTQYTYRLAYMEQGRIAHSPESSVLVPIVARFGLTGAVPNPALGRNLQVRFSLPSWQSAHLSLHDLAGRKVAMQEVGTLGPGEHTLRLDSNVRPAAGIYWLRLAQGTEQATRRCVVVE